MANKQKSILISLIFSLLFLFSNTIAYSQGPVTISVGPGAGLPGTKVRPLPVSLENPNTPVAGIQLDICNSSGYLTPTPDDPDNDIYTCETTDRAPNFWCLVQDQGGGCQRVIIVDVHGNAILKGEGPIANINYNVSQSAPLGICVDMTLENVKASDGEGAPLPAQDVIGVDGQFCFVKPASCLGVSPASGTQGQPDLQVVITGETTHFAQGVTQVSFENPEITVTNTTVNSATKVTVLITISPTAAIGKGDVTVTTDNEMIVCTDGFEVLEKIESCLSVLPSSGVQSERNKEIVIVGELTHFLQGVTQVSFENPGIVVTSTVVNSSTRVTVTVDIAYNAPPETGDVIVATGSERITCYNAFTVFERTYQISEIRESNPTSASFTVSWITDAKGNGEVHYSTDPSFSTYETARDDRGTEYVGITHHVSIGDLEPETTYYYEVKSGGTIDDNSGLYYSFATMKIPVAPPPVCPVYGWVYLEDEVTPAEGTIVYLEITHELEPSYWISGLVSPIGVWVLNLGNLYSTITNDALPYAEGDPLSLEFQGGNGRVNSAEFTVPDICPLYCGTVILEHLISELMGFDTGFNLIAFPFIVMTDSSYNEITYTACDLIGAVSGSTQAFSWDANAQQWLTALDIGGGNCIGDDFSIEPGKGYFVKCSAETTSTFYGKELAYPLPLTFEPGYNLIAVSYPPDYYTSCSLVGAIAGATKTFSWDATYQRWLSSLVIEGGLCVGDNFPIERERGYFVHSLIHIDRWVPGVGGVCSVDADCNDNNTCTNESCVDNVCLYSNNITTCDDGLFCTENDVCSGGVCSGGAARDCSAFGNQCNNASCDEGLNQCVSQPRPNGTACEDGLYCTVADQCTGGVCVAGPARDCSTSGGQCSDGVCSETTDQCIAQPKANGTTCEDGLYCTVSDQCTGGVCGAGLSRDCSSAGNQCNDGVCSESTDQCAAQPKTNGTVCEDGLYCTVSDQCVGGACTSGSARDCSTSGDQCNDGVCSETTDQCVAQPKTDGTLCNDGLYCTQTDDCQGGICSGNSDPCVDNGNYCNGVEYCVEDVGTYLCNSTGDPCDLLTCDELNDECTGSNVSLIIVDAYGYSGTIDIALANEFDSVSEMHLDVCNIDARSWLHISATGCSTTARSSDFSCAISDLGNGCVKVDLTSSTSGLIDPNTGAVAVLTYTIDPNAPLTDYADLEPRTISILDDTLPTPVSLSVTPVPGRVRAVE